MTSTFNSYDLNVGTKQLVVEELLKQIKPVPTKLYWNLEQQSRYIESLLIRFPTPPFYVDITSRTWEIIDGVQRIESLRNFVNNNFELTALEFLTDLTDLSYNKLHPRYQRRILESRLTVHIIEPGTTLDIKEKLISRIKGKK